MVSDIEAQLGPQQYIRAFKLIVSGNDGNGFDLSNLRCKFSIKRSDNMTPNSADIRIYNVEPQTALKIFSDFQAQANGNGILFNKGRVLMQGGYDANFGVIFSGNVKQVILGRETATDTFVDIVAGDGDRAYNYAIVNTTVAAGSQTSDQLFASVQAMTGKGVTMGNGGNMPNKKLARAKVMYGNARNYLREIGQTTQQSWSIQDEKINFVAVKGYLPGERVVLTSKTGLIGTPQQTNEGLNIKCLLNPLIRIGGLVQIDEADVEDFKINLANPNSPANIGAPLTADGVYYAFVVEHSGDTRGTDWYTTILGISQNPTGNALNSVQVGYNF